MNSSKEDDGWLREGVIWSDCSYNLTSSQDMEDPSSSQQFMDESRFWIQRVMVPLVVGVGVLGNVVTMVVLTRRRMRSSTNVYLTALAASDLLYLILVFTLSLDHYPNIHDATYYIYWQYLRFGYWLADAAIVYKDNKSHLSHTRYTAITRNTRTLDSPVHSRAVHTTPARATRTLDSPVHTLAGPLPDSSVVNQELSSGYHRACIYRGGNTSIWLTVSFTVERYIAVCHPMRGKMLCTESRARKVILVVYLACFLSTVSTSLEWTICQRYNGTSVIHYYMDSTKLAVNETYRTAFYWFTSVTFIFLPLTALGVFNSILIYIVHKSRRQRYQMTQVGLMYSSLLSDSVQLCLHIHRPQEPATEVPDDAGGFDVFLTPVRLCSTLSSYTSSTRAGDRDSVQLCLHIHRPQEPATEVPDDAGGFDVFLTPVRLCSTLSSYTSSTRAGDRDSVQLCLHIHRPQEPVTEVPDDAGGFDVFLTPVRLCSTLSSYTSSTRAGDRDQADNSQSQENKITVTLIAVVVLFMFCQIPTALILLYTSFQEPLRGSDEDNVLRGLGNIFNFLNAVNAACNFILYCAFSDKYRRTFLVTFFGRWYRAPSRYYSQKSRSTQSSKKTSVDRLSTSSAVRLSVHAPSAKMLMVGERNVHGTEPPVEKDNSVKRTSNSIYSPLFESVKFQFQIHGLPAPQRLDQINSSVVTKPRKFDQDCT
uniref:G-protein coupled receptors family 1 profile domain-containing protein n=1 Tax=Timema shepardi TaxID=629360 RepID=A0A7R9B0E2_TIMSH|nr:unnamed protein product [Timema shepardi]